MLSKNKINEISSCNFKKSRKKNGLFIAEGLKIIQELISSDIKVRTIYTTSPEDFHGSETDVVVISDQDLKRISNQKAPNKALCLAEIPQYQFQISTLKNKLSLALEDIRDPGNMGTIIRIADWFNIENIICSESCVDAYNSKVVQATMGSIARVKIHYVNLKEVCNNKIPVYGAFINEESVYNLPPIHVGILLVGNEANGITKELTDLVNYKVSIPAYGQAESLNAAVSTAILCSEIRRKQFTAL